MLGSREHLGRVFGTQHARRVGVETERHCCSTNPAGLLLGAFQNRPVPQMQTIEHTDGQHHGPGYLRKFGDGMMDFHAV